MSRPQRSNRCSATVSDHDHIGSDDDGDDDIGSDQDGDGIDDEEEGNDDDHYERRW